MMYSDENNFENGNMMLELIDCNYLCDTALFKRRFSNGSYEYIVAIHCSWYKTEVAWGSGYYYDEKFNALEKYNELI